MKYNVSIDSSGDRCTDWNGTDLEYFSLLIEKMLCFFLTQMVKNKQQIMHFKKSQRKKYFVGTDFFLIAIGKDVEFSPIIIFL